MSRPVILLASALICFLLSPRARASNGEVAFDDRPFNLQLRLGSATSVGVAGIVGEYDANDWLNVGAGVGSNLMGPIVGGHTRVRPFVFRTSGGNAAHALVMEFAVSRSRYAGSIDGVLSEACEGGGEKPGSPCYDPGHKLEWVWWGQAEIGWEFRQRSGFLFRATSGIAWLLAQPDWQCERSGITVPCGHGQPTPVLSSLTLGIGHTF